MACHKSKVFLGFEDEQITSKYLPYVNYTTNKIGGKPNWFENKPLANPRCRLCGLTLPLVVQVYAPLDNSPYHRTLYLFGCVNPNCWNHKESWVCLRSQLLDTKAVDGELEQSERAVESYEWCEGANDWEDEANGNLVAGDQLSNRFAALDMDEMSPVGAAGVGAGHPLAVATAEIEGEEEEVITIDTPTSPAVNVPALLDSVQPVPQVPSDTLEFVSFFMSVSEEDKAKSASPVNQEFNDHFMTVDEESNSVRSQVVVSEASDGEATEKYEKTLPAHGDRLFHQFITRIQRNPGQVLRYIREGGQPLFLYPARDLPRSCAHCHAELVCELQLLPTLLSRLALQCDGATAGAGHLEYGTVLVLACQRSCWGAQDSVRSEHVVVQREN